MDGANVLGPYTWRGGRGQPVQERPLLAWRPAIKTASSTKQQTVRRICSVASATAQCSGTGRCPDPVVALGAFVQRASEARTDGKRNTATTDRRLFHRRRQYSASGTEARYNLETAIAANLPIRRTTYFARPAEMGNDCWTSISTTTRR